MRNTLENLAGGALVIVVVIAFYLLVVASSGPCPSGDTEFWCGMRW